MVPRRLILLATLTIGLLVSSEVVLAQGLVGAPTGMRALSKTPPLLPGATDDARWQIFLKAQPTLIGMTRTQVIKLFGPGAAYLRKNELSFSLTEEKTPSQKGKVAYLELTLKFSGERLCRYTVEAVIWG
jgi:hypothetical protein